MKKCISLLPFFFIGILIPPQILQSTGQWINKDDGTAEKDNKRKEKVITPGLTTVGNTPNSNDQKTEQNTEGFITVQLSTPVTSKGLSVIISGESAKYGKWNTIELEVKGPKEEEVIKLPINDSGKYRIRYDKLLDEGDYIITATSSDGKAKANEKLLVLDWYQPNDETAELMDVTGKAFERLKDRASRLKPMIGSKDATTLDNHIDGVKKNIDGINELMSMLKIAKQETGNMLKAGQSLPRNIVYHLSQLNEAISGKAKDVKRLSSVVAHEPSENTICEYIVMLNEACAAFTTFTTGWMTHVAFFIGNIAYNKAVPKVAEKEAGPSDNKQVSYSDVKWDAKQSLKVWGGQGKRHLN